MVLILRLVLLFLMALFLVFFLGDILKHRQNLRNGGIKNYMIAALLGFVTNFFDTLGIGSFAPQTIVYKLCHMVKDDTYIPGTLNTANTIPVMFEGLIFLSIVEVEPKTLAILFITSVIGGVLGAKIESRLPVKKVQLVIAAALGMTAIFMVLRQAGILDSMGAANTATGLSGLSLVLAALALVIVGMGQALGVGFYAPCMAVVYFFGMDPLVSFPIMMGACAAVMPTSSITYVKEGKYERVLSIIITVTGIAGVAVAAFLVKNIDKSILTWIVVVVVIIASITTFKQALSQTNDTQASGEQKE